MIDAHMTAVSSVLQYVAVCCSMLQCDVVCCVMINAHITAVSSVLQYVAVCVCVCMCVGTCPSRQSGLRSSPPVKMTSLQSARVLCFIITLHM